MIARKCIETIQKDINEGKTKASDIIPAIPEKEARELYNAWRAHFIDRTTKEYYKMAWGENPPSANPVSELDYDIEYYKALVENEKSKK
jgi:hypothetical protein